MDIESPPSSDRVARASLPPDAIACRPFRYIDDPLCVCSMVIYVLNRFILKPHHIGGWFTHGYLNDLLCLPIFVPIILRLQSALGIRRHNLPPTFFEIIQNWAVFSVVYQVILPRIPIFVTADDPWDMLAYILGGLTAYLWWNRSRRPWAIILIAGG